MYVAELLLDRNIYEYNSKSPDIACILKQIQSAPLMRHALCLAAHTAHCPNLSQICKAEINRKLF